MLKFSRMFVVATLLASPLAVADEFTEVKVNIAYDPAVLGSESGVENLLETIEAHADRACRVRRASYGVNTIDKQCVEDVVSLALASIEDAMAATDQPVSERFASLTRQASVN